MTGWGQKGEIEEIMATLLMFAFSYLSQPKVLSFSECPVDNAKDTNMASTFVYIHEHVTYCAFIIQMKIYMYYFCYVATCVLKYG